MEVIATIWKKPYYHDRNQRMIEAGVDCFRIKCSHYGLEDIDQALLQARQQVDHSSRQVKLLADLPEAKIRLGEFPQYKVLLPAAKEYCFRSASFSNNPEEFIPVNFEKIASFLSVGEEFFIGDGQLSFSVTKITDENNFSAQTNNSGNLVNLTAMTIPQVMDQLNHITPQIEEILAVLAKSRPEMLSFSFISSKAMLEKLKEKFVKYLTKDWQPKIIAKIESREGVKNIEEILSAADGIMVARGDLALTMPFNELGLIQKELVSRAKQAGKYVIVATQVLQSLLENYLPMRSDILDLTNICLDKASAVMLCAETAHSEHPERAVAVAKKIIKAVESHQA